MILTTSDTLSGMKYETEGPEKEFSPILSGVLMSSATGLCELLNDDNMNCSVMNQYSLLNDLLRVVHPYLSVFLSRT